MHETLGFGRGDLSKQPQNNRDPPKHVPWFLTLRAPQTAQAGSVLRGPAPQNRLRGEGTAGDSSVPSVARWPELGPALNVRNWTETNPTSGTIHHDWDCWGQMSHLSGGPPMRVETVWLKQRAGDSALSKRKKHGPQTE